MRTHRYYQKSLTLSCPCFCYFHFLTGPIGKKVKPNSEKMEMMYDENEYDEDQHKNVADFDDDDGGDSDNLDQG